MTLRHFLIFVTVCEYGGVTAAAKKLYIAQPSVSLAISELEKHYNIKLFDRISRRLHITEAGKQLLEYATHIISLHKEIEDRMFNWSNSVTLHVGSSITIGTFLIPMLVKKFNSAYPHIKIKITIDNSDSIKGKVLSGEIDFGLNEGVTDNNQIISEKFMDDELVIVCGKNHPIQNKGKVFLNDLKNYDFILREKGSGVRKLFDSSLLVHDISIEPIWTCSSTQAILNAVNHGLGLSVLPYRQIEKYIEAGYVRRIHVQDAAFKRNLCIIYHRKKYLSEFAKLFIQEIHNISKDFNPIPSA